MVFVPFFCYDGVKRKRAGEKFRALKGGIGMTELEFGARLKQLRQEKHLTQQELADQLGVSNKSVSRWESGGHLSAELFPVQDDGADPRAGHQGTGCQRG